MSQNLPALLFGILTAITAVLTLVTYNESKKETPSFTLSRTWFIISSLIFTLFVIFVCTLLSIGLGLPIISGVTGMKNLVVVA